MGKSSSTMQALFMNSWWLPSISETVAPRLAHPAKICILRSDYHRTAKPKFILSPLPVPSFLGVPLLVEDATQSFTSETARHLAAFLSRITKSYRDSLLNITITYHPSPTPTVQLVQLLITSRLNTLNISSVPPTHTWAVSQAFPAAIVIFLQCKCH